jgi:hypothetical protein
VFDTTVIPACAGMTIEGGERFVTSAQVAQLAISHLSRNPLGTVRNGVGVRRRKQPVA